MTNWLHFICISFFSPGKRRINIAAYIEKYDKKIGEHKLDEIDSDAHALRELHPRSINIKWGREKPPVNLTLTCGNQRHHKVIIINTHFLKPNAYLKLIVSKKSVIRRTIHELVHGYIPNGAILDFGAYIYVPINLIINQLFLNKETLKLKRTCKIMSD